MSYDPRRIQGEHPPACTCVECEERRQWRLSRRPPSPPPPPSRPTPRSTRETPPSGQSPPASPTTPNARPGGGTLQSRGTPPPNATTGNTRPPGPQPPTVRPAARRPASRQPSSGPQTTARRRKGPAIILLALILGAIGVGALVIFASPGDGAAPSIVASPDPTDTPEPTATQVRKPTPTSPTDWSREGSSSTQIWNDKWVEFSEEPQVCDGVLTFEGTAKDGASVLYGANDSLPFVLYRRAELAPRPGFTVRTIPPIAGFLEPPTGNEYYPSLDANDIVASTLRTSRNGEFRLVAEWPEWLPDPDKVALGVWGYRPNYGQDNIRLAEVEGCQDE